jgi:hypothetical protein
MAAESYFELNNPILNLEKELFGFSKEDINEFSIKYNIKAAEKGYLYKVVDTKANKIACSYILLRELDAIQVDDLPPSFKKLALLEERKAKILIEQNINTKEYLYGRRFVISNDYKNKGLIF